MDFFKNWGVGLGMLGEQGAESIHTVFNQLRRTYANIPNRVAQLKSIVTEHHCQICPENRAQKAPPLKRRKTS